MINRVQLSLLISGVLGSFFSCEGHNKEPQTGTETLLGTACVIILNDWERGTDTAELLEESFDLISDFEQILSVNIPDSDVSRINRAGEEGFRPDDLVLNVLESALKIADFSAGLFDPSIGALVNLWGIGTDHSAVPEDNELNQALRTVDYRKIKIDQDGVVSLMQDGMRIDLGGIAKGYAADRVREYLLTKGVTSAIINLGGNVLLCGSKPSGDPWRIGIQDPREPRGEYLGILKTDDRAIVTSGIYERYFVEDGIHYHHILDKKNGYPVQNGVISTTIIHKESMIADGLSTALFAMGVERGMAMAETLADTSVIMVDENNVVYITENLRNTFSLTSDSAYSLYP
ncbi:MAG: hypothetical protein B6241_02655 [Spirochaetaceae bacterium 4572_59]|nr:MAG: hypothetical protein B6241_02655 [Spirochaetaceae bacterium 4572_59]